jgi:hypothetical protein
MQEPDNGLVNDEHGEPTDEKCRRRAGKRVRPDDRTHSAS